MNSPFKSLVAVVGGMIIVPTIISLFFYNGFDFEESKDKSYENKREYINHELVYKKSPTITIYNHKKDKKEKIDIEKYLYGVLSGEMPSEFDIEALKAQAVAARSYVFYKKENEDLTKHKGAVVCTDFNHCQEYKSEDELKKLKGEDWMKSSYPKIKKAVDDTRGQIITYDDKVILPLYFSTSSGKTENSEEVFSSKNPYLRSVDSPYDKASPKYTSTFEIEKDEFVKSLKRNYNDLVLSKKDLNSQIKILKKSEGGSVNKILIGNKELKGRDLRSIFNLNSSNFDIDIDEKKVVFNVRGFGHGVGMSQWGADGMAKEGFYYYEILSHYYTDTKIKDIY